MSVASPAPSGLFGDAGYVQSSTFALLDFRVSVHSDDPDVIELVELLYGETRVAADADHVLALGVTPVDGRPGCFASLDGSVVVRTPAPSIAFTNLVFEANQQAIASVADAVRLHAAAVAVGDRAVVLPGAMGAGKSTLAAALTRRGAGYLTDEVVAFALDSGSVRPYAKPISLGVPPDTLEVPWVPSGVARRYLGASGLVPPATMGTSVARAVPVAAVVLPRYVSGAPTTVERLDRAEALTAVAAQAFGLDRPGTLGRLAGLLEGVSVHRLVSGDLRAAADAVQAIIEAAAA